MDPREKRQEVLSPAVWPVMSLKTNLFLTHNRSIPDAELVVATNVIMEEEKKKKERGEGEGMRRKVK